MYAVQGVRSSLGSVLFVWMILSSNLDEEMTAEETSEKTKMR